ncbi:MAG: hypothetical protein NTZ59_02275 [Bacteroidetes bacterium]|nr:hypothetical protein [Bacteroidota bacterium]
MLNNIIYYDNVWQRVWDTHGKEYTIKEHQGWRFINLGSNKIGINKLPQRVQIKDFDDVVVNYVFGWHRTHPCPAIGYSVYRKVTGKKITLKDYYNNIHKCN